MERAVLGYKDPNKFRTRNVVAQYSEGHFNLSYTHPDVSFEEMRKLRTKVDRDIMVSELMGAGHRFANLGVGVILTLSLEGKDYLLGQQQRRPDGEVYNPIGGYVSLAHLDNPQEAVDEEVAEEFLPVYGERDLIKIARLEGEIMRPYYLNDGRFRKSSYAFFMISGAKYKPEGLGKMLIKGQPPEGNPGILFETERNAAKAVYEARLVAQGFDVRELGVSLHHSEDSFNGSTGQLDILFNPYGTLLIQLEEGKLTDQMFTMRQGHLVSQSTKGIFLSEVFLADEGSIAVQNKRSLDDFLKTQ